MTQEKLDEIWQQFISSGRAEQGYACISNGRLEHITDYVSDTTWERKKTTPEWRPVFPFRS
ncbi:MAG: hypothetical protein WA414_11050 [Acidobacteriaceae bacterium]